MKTQWSLKIMLFTLLITSLQSCQVIGGIFKAGMFAGIFVVVLVVGLIIYLISKAGGRGTK